MSVFFEYVICVYQKTVCLMYSERLPLTNENKHLTLQYIHYLIILCEITYEKCPHIVVTCVEDVNWKLSWRAHPRQDRYKTAVLVLSQYACHNPHEKVVFDHNIV